MQASDDDLQQRFEGLDRRLLDVCATDDGTMGVAFPIQGGLTTAGARYEILDEIGRGGSKIVYEAVDTRTDCRVALAVLKEGADEEGIEAFFREARVNAKLVHPNIMRVHDLGFLSDGRSYFTMALMSSESLATMCGAVLADEEVGAHRRRLVDLFVRICEGMSYAHSRDVLHLDLKPENLQVGHYGEIVISDWGLARVVGWKGKAGGAMGKDALDPDMLNSQTLTGVVKGTPGYMAPEQVDGSEERTVRTDVYALGAILYTMLTGRPPIVGKTLSDVIEATREGRIETPSTLCPKHRIPLRLERICMRALATTPTARYSSVADLQADMIRYRDGYATEAEDAGVFDQAWLVIRRNPRVSLLTGGFVIALLLITTVFVIRLQESRSDALYALGIADDAKRDAQHAEQRAVTARDAAELANEETRSMQDEAEAARNRALKALGMLAEKTLQHEQISNELAAALVSDTQEITRHYDFKNAMKKIDRALVHDPNNDKIRLQKAFTHLILQQYQQALDALPVSLKPGDRDLRLLAEQFSLGASGSDYPAAGQVADFLRTIKSRRHFFRRYVFMHAVEQYIGPEALPVIEAMLQVENDLGPESIVQLAGPSGQREFSVAGVRQLQRIDFSQERESKPRSILVGLGIRSLNLSNTGVTSVKSLEQLPNLQSLDITNTPVLSLADLVGCNRLRRLTVAEGQFSERELARLPKRITVVQQQRRSRR